MRTINMKILPKIILFSIAFLLLSCATNDDPAYNRPEIQQKNNWSNSQNNITSAEIIRPDWWTEFDDTFLNQLIIRSVESNLDLQLLTSRLRLAGIQIGLSKPSQLPRPTASSILDSTNIKTQDQEDVSDLALNWELDVWGKLQKGVDADRASYHSEEAIWRGSYLKLVADVSIKYFQIRQLDQQTHVNQRSLKQLRLITDIYREQLSEGLIPEINIIKLEAKINSALKDLIDLQRQRQVAENEISVLLGYPSGEFQVPADQSHTIKIPTVPAGLPADLLSRRPDLIAAEHQVLRAHLLVGKAKLSRLPTINVTSQGGIVNDLINGVVKTYSFGLAPTINFPIFDPTLGKRIQSTKETEKASILEYKSKVIRAFADVEIALINLHSRKNQQIELEKQFNKLTMIKNQVIEKYNEGLISQLEVLEAERSLITSEISLLLMHQQLLSDTVTLYKALGGGWPVTEIKPSDISEANEN